MRILTLVIPFCLHPLMVIIYSSAWIWFYWLRLYWLYWIVYISRLACVIEIYYSHNFFFFFWQPILYSYWRSSCSWRVRIGEWELRDFILHINSRLLQVTTDYYRFGRFWKPRKIRELKNDQEKPWKSEKVRDLLNKDKLQSECLRVGMDFLWFVADLRPNTLVKYL